MHISRKILAVAADCDGLDANALKEALIEGRARRAIEVNLQISQSDLVKGSPHLFLPDGTDVHNPGIEHHWEGDAGEGFPVVDNDTPDVYDAILRRAAAKAS